MTSKDLQRVLVNSASSDREQAAGMNSSGGEQMAVESGGCWAVNGGNTEAIGRRFVLL
jgi:hypothetical protein